MPPILLNSPLILPNSSTSRGKLSAFQIYSFLPLFIFKIPLLEELKTRIKFRFSKLILESNLIVRYVGIGEEPFFILKKNLLFSFLIPPSHISLILIPLYSG